MWFLANCIFQLAEVCYYFINHVGIHPLTPLSTPLDPFFPPSHLSNHLSILLSLHPPTCPSLPISCHPIHSSLPQWLNASIHPSPYPCLPAFLISFLVYNKIILSFYSEEEFKKYYRMPGWGKPLYEMKEVEIPNIDVPKAFDWRDKGNVGKSS